MKKLTIGILPLIMSVGCTTLQLSMNKKEMGDPIVMQAGEAAPIIAKLNREAWIEVRKTSKDGEARLFTALGTRDYQVAEQDARSYLMLHPANRTALIVLSTSRAMQFDFDMALYYGKLVQKYSGNYDNEIENLKGLAMLYKNKASQADFVEAAGHFQTAFDGSSKQIAAGFNLAHLQLLMGDAGRSEATFRQVKVRCHGCLEADIGLGIAFTKQRKFDKAKEVFAEALGKDSNNPIALYRLALIEKNGYNNNDRAMDYLKKILADNSDNHLDIKRQANSLLNRMQAGEAGKEIVQEQKQDDEVPTIAPVSDNEQSANP